MNKQEQALKILGGKAFAGSDYGIDEDGIFRDLTIQIIKCKKKSN